MEKKLITIAIDDGTEESSPITTKRSWALSFNNLSTAANNALFFYLENTGDINVYLDSISISSTQKATNIQVHSVYGEPSYTREEDVKPVNKRLTRADNPPNMVAKIASNIGELTSLGQLDRLDMLTELTTYKTKPDVTITPGTAIAITCENLGELSGIVTINTEE